MITTSAGLRPIDKKNYFWQDSHIWTGLAWVPTLPFNGQYTYCYFDVIPFIDAVIQRHIFRFSPKISWN